MRRISVLTLLIVYCSGGSISDTENIDVENFKVHFKDVIARKGDNFSTILKRENIISDSLVRILERYFADSIRILNIGDTLRYVFINDELERVELRKQRYIYEYAIRRGEFRKTRRFISYTPQFDILVIENSLWESFLKNDIPLEVFVNLVDMFSWDIDFSTETRNGDTLKILYSDAGIVYYAEYIGSEVGRKVAVRFRGSYYDEHGNNLKRMFLRSPLKSYVITSGFGIRFHPILKKYRPHHGVDYAAPYGTKVRSVGDGKVIFAGWRGGYGKTVIIRHGKGYITTYAHLSRIYVKKGQNVKQGQIIGAVGSTGLSTGPHLHFEVRRHGRLLNPLRLNLKPEKPLPEELKPEFYSLLREYRRLMYESLVSR